MGTDTATMPDALARIESEATASEQQRRLTPAAVEALKSELPYSHEKIRVVVNGTVIYPIEKNRVVVVPLPGTPSISRLPSASLTMLLSAKVAPSSSL